MSAAIRTTDHEEIRTWVESRGGTPAVVKGTKKAGRLGTLRIDMPRGVGEERLEHVSWDDWFQTFDDNALAVLYQEEADDGSTSLFSKLVKRDEPSD
ncbi:MAG: hypothetical protein HOV80_18040 [Polyangiaceae bacterium]|nr:hypothetical protein [Polyangiaceae bacterium]